VQQLHGRGHVRVGDIGTGANGGFHTARLGPGCHVVGPGVSDGWAGNRCAGTGGAPGARPFRAVQIGPVLSVRTPYGLPIFTPSPRRAAACARTLRRPSIDLTRRPTMSDTIPRGQRRQTLYASPDISLGKPVLRPAKHTASRPTSTGRRSAVPTPRRSGSAACMGALPLRTKTAFGRGTDVWLGPSARSPQLRSGTWTPSGQRRV